MPNILLIHQAFASSKTAGGTRHYEFGQQLYDMDYQLTVISSNVDYHTGQLISLEERIEDRRVKILHARTLPTIHKSFVWRVIAFLSFMLSSIWVAIRQKEIDVVWGTTPPIFQGVSAWLTAAIRRKPFLLEVRDLWPEFAIDMGILKNPFLISLSRFLESFLYSRATHIVVNSPAYRTYMIDKGISPDKVTLIPNGVDTRMFSEDLYDANLREEWDLKDKYIITYAGALGPANNIETIIDAAKLTEDLLQLHFLIVGDGKDRKKLEAYAKSLNLTNLTFVGSYPKSEVPKILATSDACVATLKDIPMFKTTYPNKIFDYMASARPIILGIDGVIREVVQSAGCGIYVGPGNSDKLAQAAKALALDPDKGKTMGQAGRDYVIVNFERSIQSKQLVETINKILY